jgi:hypothetical protein
MSRWIKVVEHGYGRETYVNLDHVVKAASVRERAGEPNMGEKWWWGWRLTLSNGEVEQTELHAHSPSWDEVAGEIIPAFSQEVLMVETGIGSRRPTKCYSTRMQVIAWRVFGDQIDPLFLEPMPDNVDWLLILPDGHFLAPNDCEYETMELVEEEYLRRLQKAWDAAHEATAQS